MVGVNWVFQPTDFANAFTVEALVGDAGFNSNPLVYGGDAYDWTHLRAGTRQDTGVTLAWTQLDAAGRLANRVVIGVHDQGFAPDPDFPSGGTIDRPNFPGSIPCSGGGMCPWHGTNVLGAAMGVPDNGFGAAGPAGPVAIPRAFYREGASSPRRTSWWPCISPARGSST